MIAFGRLFPNSQWIDTVSDATRLQIDQSLLVLIPMGRDKFNLPVIKGGACVS